MICQIHIGDQEGYLWPGIERCIVFYSIYKVEATHARLGDSIKGLQRVMKGMNLVAIRG
jgi:hypothetical protein